MEFHSGRKGTLGDRRLVQVLAYGRCLSPWAHLRDSPMASPLSLIPPSCLLGLRVPDQTPLTGFLLVCLHRVVLVLRCVPCVVPTGPVLFTVRLCRALTFSGTRMLRCGRNPCTCSLTCVDSVTAAGTVQGGGCGVPVDVIQRSASTERCGAAGRLERLWGYRRLHRPGKRDVRCPVRVTPSKERDRRVQRAVLSKGPGSA